MDLRIITKNHEADPEKGFLSKSISKSYGRGTAMPPAWKLNKIECLKIDCNWSFRLFVAVAALVL